MSGSGVASFVASTRPNKPNCSKVQVTCQTDNDCTLLCNSIPQANNFGRAVQFTCSDATKFCEANVVDSTFYNLALSDHAFLSKESVLARLPQQYRDFVVDSEGKKFVLARARYYANVARKIVTWTDDKFYSELNKMKRRIALDERRRVLLALDFEEAFTDELDQSHKTQEFVRVLLRAVNLCLRHSEDERFKSTRELIREKYNVGMSFEQVRAIATGRGAERPATTKTEGSWRAQRLNALLYHRSRLLPRTPSMKTTATTALATDNECNEDMGAGMLLARFENENDPTQTVALCTCHYPNLLTGPACKHRTYEVALDYGSWETAGSNPPFLTKAEDFESARTVCKGLAPNTTPVYSPSSGDEFYRCRPIAERFGELVLGRSETHPPEIFDSDFLLSLERFARENKTLRFNRDYVDLLKTLSLA